MYFLKKMVGFFATPLVFCSGFQILGLWFLVGGRKRLGLIVGGTGVGLLLVLSLPFVGERLMGSLESHNAATDYKPVTSVNKNANFVVVLSGGFHPSVPFSPASRLAPDTLRRLVDGMALCGGLPDAKLVLSGGIYGSSDKPATTMSDLALSLGWDSSRLILETEGKTTAEQAIRIKEIVGPHDFYLVTSANHMPRAMDLFEAEGLKPLPYPCDHIVKKPTLGWRSLLPSIYGLALSNAAIHEYLGRIHGWITGPG